MRATSLLLLSALLSAPAGEALAQSAAATKEITGTVEKADAKTGRIVVDGQTLYMPLSSEAPSPKVGDRVTFGYEEQGGKKVITTFGQVAKP